MQATTKQVRTYYKAQGCDVRISRDGHVTYRKDGDSMWLEGCWVDDYRVDADTMHMVFRAFRLLGSTGQQNEESSQ